MAAKIREEDRNSHCRARNRPISPNSSELSTGEEEEEQREGAESDRWLLRVGSFSALGQVTGPPAGQLSEKQMMRGEVWISFLGLFYNHRDPDATRRSTGAPRAFNHVLRPQRPLRLG